MLPRARVLCNSAHALRERAPLQPLDARFLRRSLACSGRPLFKCIATASVARSLILESAQQKLQHLAFIARVRNSLSLSLQLSFSAGYLSFSAGSLRLSLRLSLHLSLSLCVSPPRTLSFCFSPDRRVCHHLSSPQPQLVSASASLAQSTEVDHDLLLPPSAPTASTAAARCHYY